MKNRNIGIVTSTYYLPSIINSMPSKGPTIVLLEVAPNTALQASEFIEWVDKNKLSGVIFDDHGCFPGGFSTHSLMLAQQIRYSVKVFFVVLEPECSRSVYSVWDLLQHNNHSYHCGLRKIKEEWCGTDYVASTGGKYFCSGGDSGLEQRARDVGNHCIPERNWDNVIEYIKQRMP